MRGYLLTAKSVDLWNRLCQKTRSGFERLVSLSCLIIFGQRQLALFPLDFVRLHRRYVQYRLLRRPCQMENRSLAGRRWSFPTEARLYLAHQRQGRLFWASVSVGVLAGIATATIKLHLGLPGHKVWFWLTPVLTTRLLNRCSIGTTAGTLAAGATTLGLGGHLAGGLIGLPLIIFAGAFCDWVISRWDERNYSAAWIIPLVALLGMGANLLALVKRLFNPSDSAVHTLFGLSGWTCDLFSYLICGLIAGLTAGFLAWSIQRVSRR